MRKFSLSFLLLACISVTLPAQDTLKIMTYNLLKYGITMSGCTNPIATKNIHLKTIIQATLPDVFVVNELATNSLYAENILVNVMKVVNPAYERADFTDVAQSDETNMLYYDSQKLGLRSQSVIPHSLRDINVYTMYYKDANLATTSDTIFFGLIGVHLKAGSTTSDENQRLNQVQMIMAHMSSLGDPVNYFVMGDFNVYSSNEASYQGLVADPNLDIRFYDPINSPGSWNSNASFAAIHTQSTRTTAEADCGSNGGMDDRFDFILATDYVMQGTDRVTYLPGSYAAVGQDGLRYNQSINSPANSVVSATVANALYSMSDHLPVMLKVKIDGTPVARESFVLSQRSAIQVSQVSGQSGNYFDLLIQSRSFKDLDVTFLLMDYSGKTLIEQEIRVVPGDQRVLFPSEGLSPGIYCGVFQTGDGEVVGLGLLKL